MAESLPSWERGLKFSILPHDGSIDFVAPLVGAWIEIFVSALNSFGISVAPLVGAWIEINPVTSAM